MNDQTELASIRRTLARIENAQLRHTKLVVSQIEMRHSTWRLAKSIGKLLISVGIVLLSSVVLFAMIRG